VKQFGRKEILAFVRAMDANLSHKTTLVVVGGAAAAIQYDVERPTGDIDLVHILDGSESDVDAAAKAAVEKTGMEISVSGAAAGVAILPDGFEDRLVDARDLKLKRLTIKVPDKYDLVLSKIAADRPHDTEVVEELHKRHKLALGKLTKRFEAEMLNVSPAGARRMASAFVAAVAQLFGSAAAAELEAKYSSMKLR
jgi:hypothetical protein